MIINIACLNSATIKLLVLLSLIKRYLNFEVCKDYALGSLIFNSFYCIDYCCGNCNFRYCCSNETLSLKQYKCSNSAGKEAESKSDSNFELLRIAEVNFNTSTKKASSVFPTKSTITNKPLTIIPEVCDGFFDSYNFFVQPKKCPTFARFCCGSCNNRYCCNTSREKLNQFDCKSLSNLASKTNKIATINNFANLYVVIILVFAFLLAFSCVPFIIFINRTKNNENVQQNNIITNLNNLQTLTRSSMFDTINVNDSSVDSSVPKSSATNVNNGDDSPPAYSTLKFNKNKD